MWRWWIALAGTLVPLIGTACESGDRARCKQQLGTLVSYRTEAISGAFGDVSGAMPDDIQIKFVGTKDPEYALYSGRVAYDQQRGALIIPRRFLAAKTPNPLRAAVYYWPFYQNREYRETFPVIEALDNALWGAYLQEAAHSRGLTWPHRECTSVDVGERLPCEMLVEGIAEHLTEMRGPIFNSNRLDRIWPEDFAEFRKRVWRTDQEYLEVQRYGGILLVRPLVDEFGVPRALAYIAQTPFRIENENLRASAMHYQEVARNSLRMKPEMPTYSDTILTSGTQRDGYPGGLAVEYSKARSALSKSDTSEIGTR
jgi:hypothetical protein